MKKIFFCLLVCLFIYNLKAQNLIPNADWELGPAISTDYWVGWVVNGPDNWITTKDSPDRIYSGSAALLRDNDPPQSGLAYVMFYGSIRESGKVTLNSPIVAGQVYKLTYYLDVDNYYDTGPGAINFYFIGADSIYSPFVVNTGNWQYFTTTFTATAGATELELIGIGSNLTKIDNMTLAESGIISQSLICYGECSGIANVIPSGGNSYSYLWSNGKTTQTISGLCAGTYTVIITDDTNVITINTVTIAQPEILSATITATNPMCNGGLGSAKAEGIGGTPSYFYLWNNGQTKETATNLTAGTHTITIIDSNGCTLFSSIVISEPALLSGTISITNPLCNGDMGSATANGIGGSSSYSYLWSSGQTNQTTTGLIAGTYTVTITDQNGCSKANIVFITAPTVQAIAVSAPITKITPGDSTQLNANGGNSYQWIPATGLSCATCSNPTAKPTASTMYCVEVMDANGCTNSACVTIEVEEFCGELFVPSAFSPDNNGENDFECVFGSCIEEMTFTIFNRWGEKVFETTSSEICWDGQQKEKPMQTSMFGYYLKARLLNGQEIIKKGNITLLE